MQGGPSFPQDRIEFYPNYVVRYKMFEEGKPVIYKARHGNMYIERTSSRCSFYLNDKRITINLQKEALEECVLHAVFLAERLSYLHDLRVQTDIFNTRMLLRDQLPPEVIELICNSLKHPPEREWYRSTKWKTFDGKIYHLVLYGSFALCILLNMSPYTWLVFFLFVLILYRFGERAEKGHHIKFIRK